MLKVAEGLRDRFRTLLRANELSWRQGQMNLINTRTGSRCRISSSITGRRTRCTSAHFAPQCRLPPEREPRVQSSDRNSDTY